MSIKVVNEDIGSIDSGVKLDLSGASTLPDDVYDRIYDLTVNGVMISPKYEETPCPWDADINIEGDYVVISGAVEPSGTMSGTCVVKVKKSSVNDLYDICLDFRDFDSAEELAGELGEYGWVIEL